jgi:hypothetical protein
MFKGGSSSALTVVGRRLLKALPLRWAGGSIMGRTPLLFLLVGDLGLMAI